MTKTISGWMGDLNPSEIYHSSSRVKLVDERSVEDLVTKMYVFYNQEIEKLNQEIACEVKAYNAACESIEALEAELRGLRLDRKLEDEIENSTAYMFTYDDEGNVVE